MVRQKCDMRIVCPQCAAVYNVPDEVLARPPRLFRCARCTHQWTPPSTASPAVEPSPDPLPPPAAAVPRAPPRVAGPAAAPAAVLEIPPRPQPQLALGAPLVEDGRPGGVRAFGIDPVGTRPVGSRRFGVTSAGAVAGIVGWVLTAAILAIAVAVVLLRRPEIEALWPSSQRLYAMLGLH